MSRLLCCVCAGRPQDMGAAISHPQEGEACDSGTLAALPTMADVIRERKKKSGSASLGTLRRRLAAAARRPRDSRPDRDCEHGRFIRSVVSSWRLSEVGAVCEQLEAAAALRDLHAQAALARPPATQLHHDLYDALQHRWWCDVELVGAAGWSVCAHRAVLAARSTYFRDLLLRYPSGTWRVPLDGVGASLSRSELETSLRLIYKGDANSTHQQIHKCERGSDGDLDIISVENTGTWSRGVCSGGTAVVRRLSALLGFAVDTLHADMRYLLDSGEYADCRLSFRGECTSVGSSGTSAGGQFGFVSGCEVSCHALVLAARSRFFRSVLSRRSAGGGTSGMCTGTAGGTVCVDEKVLPRRYARALLHAAYTDQVDLSLVGRSSSSPSSTNSTGSGNSTVWGGVRGVAAGGGGGSAAAGGANYTLDVATQLYDIARFVEMPILVQGCEDRIVEALSADTLPRILRWAQDKHASHWVYRQAMRYLLDEFVSVMSSVSASRLPRAALADALKSNFLQASEAQALRALIRYECGSGGFGGASRRAGRVTSSSCGGNAVMTSSPREGGGGGAGGVTGGAGGLAALVRIEHLPPDNEVLLQAIRRGVVDARSVPGGSGTVSAWLGRGAYRPPRCFLPHLDEMKALLLLKSPPEAEVARVRRARLAHRIPDTLYMVAAAQEPEACGSDTAESDTADTSCVSPRLLTLLRNRYVELCGSATAMRALRLHRPYNEMHKVYRQIALRAVREWSLPDSCAELLLYDAADMQTANDTDSDSATSVRADTACCDVPHESSSSCRREMPTRPDPVHRSWRTEYRSSHPRRLTNEAPTDLGTGSAANTVTNSTSGTSASCTGTTGTARLSLAVPDVAMAPNANTHLLTARDYCRLAHSAVNNVQQQEFGGVLQLDLGDGATHTPRPGSRALRAAHSADRARQPRDRPNSGTRRPEDDDLRAALELSVIRAYSSLSSAGRSLPHSYRHDLPHHPHVRPRVSPGAAARIHLDDAGCSPSVSPRRPRRDPPLEYRLEPSYSGSRPTSRGHSPNSYA